MKENKPLCYFQKLDIFEKKRPNNRENQQENQQKNVNGMYTYLSSRVLREVNLTPEMT